MLPPGLPRRLGEERLRVWPLLLLGVAVLLWLGWLALGDGRLDPGGRAVGADYVALHAAGELVLQGRAAEVYHPSVLHAEMTALAAVEPLPVHYPPPALLLFALPALLPYELGLLAWLAVGVAAFVATARALFRGPLARRWTVAHPGLLLSVMQGQTGALVGAGLATGLGLARHPWLAGLALGCLVIKPNYLPVAGLCLLVAGHWRVLAGAVLSALSACGASVLLLGIDPWRGWLADLSLVVDLAVSGALPLHKMPTVLAALLQVGVPTGVAHLVQGGSGVIAAAVAAWVWRVSDDVYLRLAATILATLLLTPFAFDYDLAATAFAVTALAVHLAAAGRGSTGRWLLIAAGWALPLALPGLAAVGLPIAPLVLGALLGLVAIEARA